MWAVGDEGLVGLRDGQVVGRHPAWAGATGVAVGPAGVLVAHPPTSQLVLVDPTSGGHRPLVAEAPIGPPVAGARLPYANAPVVADGDGFLVGCPGDGTIRRLRPTS